MCPQTLKHVEGLHSSQTHCSWICHVHLEWGKCSPSGANSFPLVHYIYYHIAIERYEINLHAFEINTVLELRFEPMTSNIKEHKLSPLHQRITEYSIAHASSVPQVLVLINGGSFVSGKWVLYSLMDKLFAYWMSLNSIFDHLRFSPWFEMDTLECFE